MVRIEWVYIRVTSRYQMLLKPQISRLLKVALSSEINSTTSSARYPGFKRLLRTKWSWKLGLLHFTITVLMMKMSTWLGSVLRQLGAIATETRLRRQGIIRAVSTSELTPWKGHADEHTGIICCRVQEKLDSVGVSKFSMGSSK